MLKKRYFAISYRSRNFHKSVPPEANCDEIYFHTSSLGLLGLTVSGENLTHLFFPDETAQIKASIPDSETFQSHLNDIPPVVRNAWEQLDSYLDGTRKIFNLPMILSGTPFQEQVWEKVSHIPYGQVCSYQDIARTLGCPEACRAVGTAVGKNPLPIFIPCHRVIRSDGSLGGYRGGIQLKRRLLLEEMPK